MGKGREIIRGVDKSPPKSYNLAHKTIIEDIGA